MTRILVISGSSRSGSPNATLATLAADILNDLWTDSLAQLFDLSSLDLPVPGQAANGAVNDLLSKFASADALVVSSDEYTGSYSSTLRRALHWISLSEDPSDPLIDGKPVLLVGTAVGGINGLRGFPVTKHLLETMGGRVETTLIEIYAFDDSRTNTGPFSDAALNGLCSRVQAWADGTLALG